MTTLADEIAAWTVIALKQRFGFTAELSARLHLPVRTGIEVVGTGRLTKDTSRIAGVSVKLEQQGKLALSAELTFVLLDEKGAERLLGAPLPEAWKKFARGGANEAG